MRLSVTTPRGALVDTDVDEVTAPGLLGELGVLPGHVPLMAALKPGVLTYRLHDKPLAALAVSEGFLQIAPVSGKAADAGTGPDRVLVLVDQAAPPASIDRAAVERELVKLEGEIAAWKQELDGTYRALCLRRDWAQARLDAVARANPS